MNRLTPSLLLLLIGCPAVICSGGDLSRLQFVKSVQRQPARDEEILAIPLDADVYAATQDGWPDLRILGLQGAEIPYRIERATDTAIDTQRRPCRSAVRSLQTHEADNSIEVLVDLEKDAPAAGGLTVITPLKDFERRVSVLGSDDGAAWQPLTSDGMIFDYSRFMDVANGDIPLARNAFRHLKLVIQEVVDQSESPLVELTRRFAQSDETQRTERSLVEHRPLRIDRIDLWHNVPQQRVKQNVRADYPIVAMEVEEDRAQKSTIIHVQTRREPLVRFTLQTPSVNFHRAAVVEAPSPRGVTVTWTPVGRATLSRFRFRDFQREQLTIEFAEQRHTEYRIVIANGDSAPLEVTGVRAEGLVVRALMLAAPDADYQLCYGDTQAVAPQYDTAAIDVALAQGFSPAVATLGGQRPNPDFGGSSWFGPADWLDHPFFLGGVIAAMVAVLGFLVFRAGRRIDGWDEERDTPGPANPQA